MNIKEIATFPVQLEQVETLSIQAEKYSSEVRQEFSISASVKGEVVDKSTGKSTIEIKVCNDDFSIEEKKVGIFKFQEEITDEEAAIIYGSPRDTDSMVLCQRGFLYGIFKNASETYYDTND